jgi:hypothetical protein
MCRERFYLFLTCRHAHPIPSRSRRSGDPAVSMQYCRYAQCSRDEEHLCEADEAKGPVYKRREGLCHECYSREHRERYPEYYYR